MTHESQPGNNSDVLNKLQTHWCDRGLAKHDAGIVSFVPTFIEEVGKASAETVRAAALVRLFNANEDLLKNWLKIVLPDFVIPHDEELRATREFSFDPKNRVDIAIKRKDGKEVVFVEVKWLAPTDDQQLLRYLKCINQDHGGARLIILSPIAHVWNIEQQRQGPQKTQEVGITTWAQLWETMKEESLPYTADRTVEDDLYFTIERLYSFQSAIHQAVTTNARLEEVFAVDKWLEEAIPVDDSYRALLRMTLVTELAEQLVKRRNKDSAWRSQTAAGPRNDWQADVSFGREGESYVTLPLSDQYQYLKLFTRFHLYKEADCLRVLAGSELGPYLEGKKKKDWETKDTPDETQSIVFESLGRLREALVKKLINENLTVGGNPRTKTKPWFKSFSSVKFDGEATFEDVFDHAQSISNAVIGALGEFS